MEMPQGQPPGPCQTTTHFGDFETTVDGGRLLMVTNVPTGASFANPRQDIVVVDIDGQDGRTVNGVPDVVATNYRGCYGVNGPEWVTPPAGGAVDLGIVFAGSSTPMGNTDGVHGVFRPSGAQTFDLELTAAGTLAPVTMDGPDPTPVLLPSSPAGAYPDGSPADGQPAYAAFKGSDCNGKCFGFVNGTSTMTSITDHAMQDSLLHGASIGHVLDSSGSHVLTSACSASDPFGTCGLYLAQIDGQGGLVPQGASDFAQLGDFTGRTTSSSIAAAVYPDGTDQCAYIFLNEVDGAGNGDDSIHVYRQHASDLTIAQHVTTITALDDGSGLGAVEHFRAVPGDGELVLHYLDRDASDDRDSYVVRVTNSCSEPRQSLVAHPLSEAGNGTELVWLPDGLAPWTQAGSPGAWAVYIIRENELPAPTTAKEIARCWWRP
jgi:hypothetical protein